MSFGVPAKAELKDMLGMLYSGLEVEDSDALDLSSAELVFGLYIDDEDNPAALIVCDLSFGANMGCGMTMIPAPVAKDAIKSGKLEDMMISNLNEVANIVSRLFMLGSEGHLRFATMHPVSDGLPDSVAGLLGNIGRQAFFEVTPKGYGAGIVGFLTP